jgi:nitroreductase
VVHLGRVNPLLETILRRTSIRKFKAEKIPETDIKTIVECGQHAPTGGNSQLYTLIEIRDDALRKKITAICHQAERVDPGSQEFINDASHFFVVCVDVRRIEKIVQQVGERPTSHYKGPLSRLIFGIMDATLVAQNMVIAAEALGYASIYIGSITTEVSAVSKLLRLPRGVLPAVGLALGVPTEHPSVRPRFPQKIIWQIDQYRDSSPKELSQTIKLMDEAAPGWSTRQVKKFQTEKRAIQKQWEDLQTQGFLERFDLKDEHFVPF